MESKRVLDKAFEYMDRHFSGRGYYAGSVEWARCLSQARYYYACRRREYLSWVTGYLESCFAYPAVGSRVVLKPEVQLRSDTDRVQRLVLGLCGWSSGATEALISRYGGMCELEVCAESAAYPLRIGFVGVGGYYEYVPAVLFRGYFGDVILNRELVEELLDASFE